MSGSTSDRPSNETPKITVAPKDVIVYYMNPGMRNFLISMRLRNEKGVLAEVSSMLAKAHTNILSGQVSVTSSRASWTFFAETEKKGVDAQGLTQVLKGSKFVESVVVKEDVDGLIFDDIDFPLRWNEGERAVLIRKGSLNTMFGQLRERLGTGGEVVLYDEGYNSGADTASKMVQKLGRPFLGEHLAAVVTLYTAVGWGRISLIKYDLRRQAISLKAEDCFDYDGSGSPKPHSQFLRGNMCGFFSTLLDLRLKCEETKCVGMGAPHCQFELTPE